MAVSVYIVFTAILLLFQTCRSCAKDCKKLDKCRCEMSDGSGIVDLWKIDNSDGIPRFSDISSSDSLGSPYTYSFNPCTTIKSCGSNLCRLEKGKSDHVPCGQPDPTFTVNEHGNAIMNFKELDQRSTKIVLVCDSSTTGIFSDGIGYTSSSGTEVYTGRFSSRYACAFPSHGLSAGSILLIIFFSCLLLYVIVGVVINVKFRHKERISEAFPNHSFWVDFPFLVKDGCVFSFKSAMKCCGKVSRKEGYSEI